MTVNEPIVLWPPNHRLVTYTLADLVTIEGGCGDTADANAMGEILFIYCDEPRDGQGDGPDNVDIVIRDAHTFSVVAERSGPGNGRVYGVHFEIRNGSAAPVEYTAFIYVPHDQSGREVIDDGAASGQTVRR